MKIRELVLFEDKSVSLSNEQLINIIEYNSGLLNI